MPQNGTSAVLVLLSVTTVVHAEAVSPSDRVDQLFERYNRTDSPGCAVGVIRDGKLVHGKGYGMELDTHRVRVCLTLPLGQTLSS